MDQATFKNYQEKAVSGEVTDNLNPSLMLQGIDSRLLAKVLAGEIDLNELAKREMEGRGLNAKGEWVGFNKTIK